MIPKSFEKDGFVPLTQARKTRRLMIGCDGGPDSGKTEFALSGPGPLAWLALDRGIDGVLDNPNPPATRCKDIGLNIVNVPKATQLSQPGYIEYWKEFYGKLKGATDNPDVRTILLDGDSDSWELQRLAEFGRLSKVPSNLYDNVNAARRAMYARLWDSGKIVVATNKVRRVFITKLKPDGTPEINNSGNEVRVWNGEYERQGFSDQEYLWSIQLRHMNRVKEDGTPEWGLRIMKCKADMSLVGMELWGADCHMPALLESVYPHIPLSEWGY
jgi:hypothetical protein